MIKIGLAGWGDHDALYTAAAGSRAGRGRSKLSVYSDTFGFVEVDSSFYAIPALQTVAKWCEETPPDFRFLVKAYQGLTGHARGPLPYKGEDEMYVQFREALAPLSASGKLTAVLFQYPPWFTCTRAHVDELRRAKERMAGIPCALEFRHQSWYADDMRERTLSFMRSEGWIHSICDEPQAGETSIPIVEEATAASLTVVRFHGRNEAGWNGGGRSDWRAVRYLYRYNEQELMEWADRLKRLERQSGEVCVVFNNNSGGDAADNALQLMAMLGLRPVKGETAAGQPPEQLELFAAANDEGE